MKLDLIGWGMAIVIVFTAVIGSRRVLAQAIPLPVGTGVNVHTWSPWNNQTDMTLIRQAGFRFIRADLGWRWTEPQAGRYNWTLADGWLAAANTNGIRCIFTLDYNNPLWSGSQDDKTGLNTPANREAYARWCQQAVQHFRNRGVIWEVWNEPNNLVFWKPTLSAADYMSACSLAAVAIRQNAGSTDPIIGPATTFNDRNVVDPRSPNNGLTYLNTCFALGLLGQVDGVSVHTYRPPGQLPETAVGFYNAMTALMAGYGTQRPIVSGEWGYTRFDVGADNQAKYNSRSMFVNAMCRVPISILYNWSDSAGTTSREAQFGLVGATQPRTFWPAYYAAKAANSVINNGTLRSTLTPNGGKSFLQAWSTTNNGTVYVAWHSGTGTATINVTGAYDVFDYLGQPLGRFEGGSAGKPLTIDGGVRYLRRGLPATYQKQE